MFSRSADTSRCGIEFNVPPDGAGITAYNNTGGDVLVGDVVYLAYSGEQGKEVMANIPVGSIAPTVIEAVRIEDCAKGTIGKFQYRGTCKKANVLGVAIQNRFLEMIAGVAYDDVATNLAFVKGNANTEDTIIDSLDGFETDGFKPGMNIVVANATNDANNKTFKIKSVTSGTLTLESYGQLVSEAGNAGTSIKAQGFLQVDGEMRTMNSSAVAMQLVADVRISVITVYLIGCPVILAAS